MKMMQRAGKSHHQKCPGTLLGLPSVWSFAPSWSLLSSKFPTMSHIIFIQFFDRSVWPQVQNHFWPEPPVKVWFAEK